jgi:hypothetical protein
MKITIKIKGSYKKFNEDVKTHLNEARDLGLQWINASTAQHYEILLAYLETQGRGGAPPPLSPITRQLYSRVGEPDGSGIRNHIKVETGRSKNRYWGRVYIADGKPAMIAKVQNDGAIIRVTDAMRGYLAANGVFLRSSTQFIEIPGRHFWDNSQKEAQRRAAKSLRALNGK